MNRMGFTALKVLRYPLWQHLDISPSVQIKLREMLSCLAILVLTVYLEWFTTVLQEDMVVHLDSHLQIVQAHVLEVFTVLRFLRWPLKSLALLGDMVPRLD